MPSQAALPLLKTTRLESCAYSEWPVSKDWQESVTSFFNSTPGQQLCRFLSQRLANNATIYPPQPLRALELTPRASVKVVIVGQDPYHGADQAEGLAFSVPTGVKLPPSLRNIAKELERDHCLQQPVGHNGSLVGWAKQGVLLLNTSLTVEDGQPASHAKQGWERLTDALLQQVAATTSACVYMLWGMPAQGKAPLIQQAAEAHGRTALILRANHPSPLSALRPPIPFIGCGHFQQANHFLRSANRAEIDWSRIGQSNLIPNQ